MLTAVSMIKLLAAKVAMNRPATSQPALAARSRNAPYVRRRRLPRMRPVPARAEFRELAMARSLEESSEERGQPLGSGR
jgi:hypothetical protein